MDVKQIKRQLEEEAIIELNQELTDEKRIEILKIHNILVARKLKKNISDLGVRKRMYNIYTILITEKNIESCYNLPIQVFIDEFYGCTLKGITD